MCVPLCLGYINQDDIFQIFFLPTNCMTSLFLIACSTPFCNKIFCTHSSVGGHLCSFQLLAITNKAAMNIVEMCPCYMLEYFLGICPIVIQLGLQLKLFPIFLGTARLISKVVIAACCPTNNGGLFFLSTAWLTSYVTFGGLSKLF